MSLNSGNGAVTQEALKSGGYTSSSSTLTTTNGNTISCNGAHYTRTYENWGQVSPVPSIPMSMFYVHEFDNAFLDQKELYEQKFHSKLQRTHFLTIVGNITPGKHDPLKNDV